MSTSLDFPVKNDGDSILVAKEGMSAWFKNDNSNNFHRVGGPAFISKNGEEWWIDGKRHREDGPAIERINGHEEWWINGERHRIDGPAVKWADGEEEWWQNGERHRVDGPARVKYGKKFYYIAGKKITLEQLENFHSALLEQGLEKDVSSVSLDVLKEIFRSSILSWED